MRTSRLTDEQLIDRIAVVFRQQGYAGASLSALSQATGLERASLYHRFPGGKEQMAESVLAYIGAQMENELFALLRIPGNAQTKLAAAVTVIEAFYQSGHLPCILETLSLETATPKIRQALAAAATAFLDALTALAQELGGANTALNARERAAAALAALEGALIVMRVTSDPSHFRNALDRFPRILSGDPAF